MKAYIVVDIEIHNYDEFEHYINKIPEYIAKHGGRYIVRGEVPTITEGDWNPERIAIIEFPSSDALQAFRKDPEAQVLFDLRKRTTHSKVFWVEGCT